jgi:hypothetical protein
MMDDRPRLRSALMTSATATTLERGRLAVTAAVRHSRAAALVAQRHAQWTAMPSHRRHFATGLMLLSSAAIHVLLNLLAGDTAGVFWLIIPALAACAGAIGVIMGSHRLTSG